MTWSRVGKLAWMLFLVLLLVAFARSSVDFVYRGF